MPARNGRETLALAVQSFQSGGKDAGNFRFLAEKKFLNAI
jgi:hypothetical protein